MKTDPSAPASPFHLKPGPVSMLATAEPQVSDFPGFTKRERIALNLHGKLIRAAAFNQAAEDMMVKARINPKDFQAFIAHLAVDAADALIVALNTP